MDIKIKYFVPNIELDEETKSLLEEFSEIKTGTKIKIKFPDTKISLNNDPLISLLTNINSTKAVELPLPVVYEVTLTENMKVEMLMQFLESQKEILQKIYTELCADIEVQKYLQTQANTATLLFLANQYR
ncbi:MAG: hypothetical protein E6R13_09010 [Spirochaetes bacterium]|nr:MAG: hypothetical protein E6R13_09010 [Spirochaetota bacterium]